MPIGAAGISRSGGFAFGVILLACVAASAAPADSSKPLIQLTQSGVSTASGGSVPAVTSADLQLAGDVTRLVFDVSAPVSPSGFVLADPDRVIVDLPEVEFRIDPAIGRGVSSPPPVRGDARRRGGQAARPRPLGGSIGAYRFGLFARGKSRIVIDIVEPVRIATVVGEPATAEHGPRLVIELQHVDRATFLAEVASSARPRVEAPAAVEAKPVDASELPVVVLDAGHGGPDTGARAPSGMLEKDIVFEFAKTLAARLMATRQYKVVLTRDSDVFIPLGERVRLARAAGAALFMSIHADTLADEPSVSGATVYTVSDKASDAEAARVADKENQADAAGGLDGRDDQSDVSDILFDLTRRETRAYSHVFARTLVGYWKETSRLNKNPHRAAGFRVLKAPDVPSVLLELGYLSSERDLSNLVSAEWRDKATGTVARAIEAFFRARERKDPPQKGAENGGPDGATESRDASSLARIP